MSNAENVHTPPSFFSGNDISTGVLNYLNGEDKLSKAQLGFQIIAESFG
jgi:hypothetical protein